MKIGVIHTGARDSYQVACAFSERDALGALYTSTYGAGLWKKTARRILNKKYNNRSSAGLDQSKVFGYMFIDAAKAIGRAVGLEKHLSRRAEVVLAQIAARGCRSFDAVISYNYLAHIVFPKCNTKKVLFQCHPNPSAALDLMKYSNDKDTNSSALSNHGFGVEREISWGQKYCKSLFYEYREADLILAPSTFVRRSLLNAGADNSKICVIPYGCDETISGYQRSLRTIGRKKLLYVGQLVWRKGADLLPGIAKAMSASYDLVIVTRGLCDTNILAELKALQNVTIHRDVPRNDLNNIFMESNALLFPSRFEGYGLVINEAISFGLPVIATNNTALPDLLEYSNVGVSVESLEIDEICAAIEHIFREKHYSEYSRAALSLAQVSSWSNFRKKVYSAVEEVCETSS